MTTTMPTTQNTMTNRITEKQLQAVVDRINIATGSPIASYVEIDGKFTAQPGNYHLDGAYGGWKLSRMSNQGGGTSDVFHSGFCTKRELYDQLHAFLRGLEAKKGVETV